MSNIHLSTIVAHIKEIEMTFLITGATGDIGSRVVELLLQQGIRPRVFVRNAAKAQSLFGDRVDIFPGDLADAEALRAALEGADSLFLLNSGPQIPWLDSLAAAAAKPAGVSHIVKLSSIDVEKSLAIGAWHERGETAIRASGVPFTFARPTGFMSNLLAWATSIQAEGVIRTCTGDGRRAFIHSADIAGVVVQALTTRAYLGEALAITGPEAVTFAEAAAKIGTAIGKPVRFEAISDEEAMRRFAASGEPVEVIEAHGALWRAIREGRLGMVTDEVERVLGRKPISVDAWALENAAAFLPHAMAIA
jgi:uncharacterized protein YbjT (DUF2867 family)